MSLLLSHRGLWRFVPAITAIISTIQIFTSPAMPESPVWLSRKGDLTQDGPVQSSVNSANDAAEAGQCLLFFGRAYQATLKVPNELTGLLYTLDP